MPRTLSFVICSRRLSFTSMPSLQDHISENGIVADDPDSWERWFDGMGHGAAQNGVRVMYCMAYAPVLLNSVR